MTCRRRRHIERRSCRLPAISAQRREYRRDSISAEYSGQHAVGADRRLGRRAIVAVVKPADLRSREDPPSRRSHDCARDRRVLPECHMRSRLHVVRDVPNEHPLQSRRIHHNDVIEALTSERLDHALHVSVLPRRPWSCANVWMFMAAIVVATSAKTASRSCSRYPGASLSGTR